MPSSQVPYCRRLHSQHPACEIQGQRSMIKNQKIVQSTFKHWKTDVQDREHGPVVTTWHTGVTLPLLSDQLVAS